MNITAKILGYAHGRGEVIRLLAQICGKSRSLANTHMGAIRLETVLVLRTRTSPHLTDDRSLWAKHNFEFPSPGAVSYENPLVGAKQRSGHWYGMNYIFRNGLTPALTHNHWPKSEYRDSLIEPEADVRKVTIWGSKFDHKFCGFKLYDAIGKCVLTVGYTNKEFFTECRTFELRAGERIIGIKAFKMCEYFPSQIDPVFVIGRLE